MSTSTLANLDAIPPAALAPLVEGMPLLFPAAPVSHSADRQAVEGDVQVSLNVVWAAWHKYGAVFASGILRLEDDFLTAVHGPGYHQLPAVARVLEARPS